MKIFLAVFLGVIAFLALISFLIYLKIKKFLKGAGVSMDKNIINSAGEKIGTSFLKSTGFSSNDIKSMIQEGERDHKYRHRSISGLTETKLKYIIKDFPDFSLDLLYSISDGTLNSIFNSYNTGIIDEDKKLSLIKFSLQEKLENLKASDRKINYSNVKFHEHVIKDYSKENGAAVITVQSSCEYNYVETLGGKKVKEYTSYPKQTSYTPQIVYDYDESYYKDMKDVFGMHCPNCGAPVKSFGDNIVCIYCGSGLQTNDMNMKSWFLSYYKEDDR